MYKKNKADFDFKDDNSKSDIAANINMVQYISDQAILYHITGENIYH